MVDGKEFIDRQGGYISVSAIVPSSCDSQRLISLRAARTESSSPTSHPKSLLVTIALQHQHLMICPI